MHEHVRPSRLADWLLERGVPAVTTNEAAAILGTDASRVRTGLARSCRSGTLISPARGLYVPVPLEYRLTGTVDPVFYIDSMMRKLGRGYRVGWLTAAALHGASHQASQVFQVAVDRPLPDRVSANVRLRFLSRSYASILPSVRIVRPAGVVHVASVEATMLMLSDDHSQAGGLDNAATSIIELAEGGDDPVEGILACADLFSVAAARRVGWVLDTFADGVDTDRLAGFCQDRSSSLSILSPGSPRNGTVSDRWSLLVNRRVDPDL